MDLFNEGAASASAARNKLATSLQQFGIFVKSSVPGCPPKDKDFLEAIEATLKRRKFKEEEKECLVIFDWWQCTYKIPVPSDVITAIKKRQITRYDLFYVHSRTGNSYFYLALNNKGKVTVHRFKRWSSLTDEIETTFEYLK